MTNYKLTRTPKIGDAVKTIFGERCGNIVEISDSVEGRNPGTYYKVEFEVAKDWPESLSLWFQADDLCHGIK